MNYVFHVYLLFRNKMELIALKIIGISCLITSCNIQYANFQLHEKFGNNFTRNVKNYGHKLNQFDCFHKYNLS